MGKKSAIAFQTRSLWVWLLDLCFLRLVCSASDALERLRLAFSVESLDSLSSRLLLLFFFGLLRCLLFFGSTTCTELALELLSSELGEELLLLLLLLRARFLPRSLRPFFPFFLLRLSRPLSVLSPLVRVVGCS